MALIPKEQYEQMFSSDFPVSYDQYAAIVAAKQQQQQSSGGYGPADWLSYQEGKGALGLQRQQQWYGAPNLLEYEKQKSQIRQRTWRDDFMEDVQGLTKEWYKREIDRAKIGEAKGYETTDIYIPLLQGLYGAYMDPEKIAQTFYSARRPYESTIDRLREQYTQKYKSTF